MEPVVLSGSHYEQGRQHGSHLKDSVLALVAERFQYRPTWDLPRVERFVDRIGANLEHWCPWLIEEMRGIADGAGLSYRDILTFNSVADISLVNLFCSNIAFCSTADGPALGKTNDVGRDAQRYHVLLKRVSGAGQPLLWVTWPGTVWANCFVNGAGLCYGGASVKIAERNEDGIPSNILQRVVADTARDVGQAVARMQAIPIMHHPLHAAFADAGGAVAAVEKAPHGCDVRLPDDRGFVVATNHFVGPTLSGADAEGYSAYDSHGVEGYAQFLANSRARKENLERLGAAAPPSAARIESLLADHSESGAICQHGAMARPGYEGMWTTTAYVALPRTRSLRFAYGRPCEVPFEVHSLPEEPAS